MRRRAPADHLSSSLTDLMTSLMVIFILLLVAKLNSQATVTLRSAGYIFHQLQTTDFLKSGEKVRQDSDVIVLVVPQDLMSFKEAPAENGGAAISQRGKAYLSEMVPRLASTLCQEEARKHIDTIIVEGHSDRKGFGSGNESVDKQENLKLSQQRSMAVVSEAMNLLAGNDRACFLDLLSATGRGDAHPINLKDLYGPENRRVEFRIKVKPDLAGTISASVGQLGTNLGKNLK